MNLLRYCILAVLVSITVQAQAQNQDRDLILTGTLDSARHYITGSITTQGETQIPSDVDLDLVARTTITFEPGFRVVAGGTLRAATSPDTDGDLILDVLEQRSGCSNYLLADTDGDGLLDNEEDSNRNGIHEPDLGESCACNRETDGDKMDDKWEKDHGLDPLVDDASLDPDGDKLPNFYEYYFGSDPQDGSSLPPRGSHYEYDELGRIKKIIRIK
ncbi:MAG: hypothetical protein GY710_13705 [Desulfobacteraceae bacterium]|nr:hypothetical protein [Desulfobacteraceae bacterium]